MRRQRTPIANLRVGRKPFVYRDGPLILTEFSNEVETIKCRRIEEDGSESFSVKWKDCEKESWVPEESFKGVGDDSFEENYKRMAKENNPIVESDSVSGYNRTRRLDDTSERKRKRQQGKKGNARNAIATSLTTEKKSVRPSGSWEDKIQSFDACRKRRAGGFMLYFRWRNGDKCKADSRVFHEKCPEKLLAFYEEHINAPFEDEVMPENNMEALSSPPIVGKQSALCNSCEDEAETIGNLESNGAGLRT